MKFIRAAVATVIGLFVSDWTQTVGILAILGLWLPRRAAPARAADCFGVALLLAAHLVFTTLAETRRRRSARRR